MNQLNQELPTDEAAAIARDILDQTSGKWSVLALWALSDGPLRFNAVRRRLTGVTQKALTDTLRRLERNGMVERRVLDTAPVGVEYGLTPLGASAKSLYCALYSWTFENSAEIASARARFDERLERA